MRPTAVSAMLTLVMATAALFTPMASDYSAI